MQEALPNFRVQLARLPCLLLLLHSLKSIDLQLYLRCFGFLVFFLFHQDRLRENIEQQPASMVKHLRLSATAPVMADTTTTTDASSTADAGLTQLAMAKPEPLTLQPKQNPQPKVQLSRWQALPLCLKSDQPSLDIQPSSQPSMFFTKLNLDVRSIIYRMLAGKSPVISIAYEAPGYYEWTPGDIGHLMVTCRDAMAEVTDFLKSSGVLIAMNPSTILGLQGMTGPFNRNTLQHVRIDLPKVVRLPDGSDKSSSTSAAQALLHCFQVCSEVAYVEIVLPPTRIIDIDAGILDDESNFGTDRFVQNLHNSDRDTQKEFFIAMAGGQQHILYDIICCAQILAEESVLKPCQCQCDGHAAMGQVKPQLRLLMHMKNEEFVTYGASSAEDGTSGYHLTYNLNNRSLSWVDGDRAYEFVALFWREILDTLTESLPLHKTDFYRRGSWKLTNSFLSAL